jgi:hypothetical protein
VGIDFPVADTATARVAATPALVAVSSSWNNGTLLSLVESSAARTRHSFDRGNGAAMHHALTATSDAIVASWFSPFRLIVNAFSTAADQPSELAMEETLWVTLRVGERLLGARVIGPFSAGNEIEVVQLPGYSE